jgi:dephospho-CoA kinase
MASVVFKDASARRRLNKATHLPVLLGIMRQILGHWFTFKPILVIDMPLLFETGFYNLTRPNNILVTCRPDLQLERLKERNSMSQQDAEARIASQMPLEQKSKLADVVINNDGTLEELENKVAVVEQLQLRRGRWLHSTAFSPAGVAIALILLWHVIN